jgi:glutathione S-transferase
MIELYIQQSCPFCQRVLRGADEMGLVEDTHYVVIEASPGSAGREKVQSLGGRSMVPFLVDGATVMYESLDIISYLEEHGRDK